MIAWRLGPAVWDTFVDRVDPSIGRARSGVAQGAPSTGLALGAPRWNVDRAGAHEHVRHPRFAGRR